jgi:predicted DsbA family dithiol-disulfide isomerase
VLEEDTRAKQELDVHGVPCFFIGKAQTQQRFRLEGAQPVAAFSKVFEQIAG